MNHAISFIRYTRTSIQKHVADLSQEQFLAMPGEFDNNIAWNIGHIMVAQQGILYRRSGLPVTISDEMTAMYKPGTSPTDWTTEPNGAALVEQMMAQQQVLEDDYAAGKFGDNYEPATTSGGLNVPDFEAGLVFNSYHEAMHWGFIQALKNFVV